MFCGLARITERFADVLILGRVAGDLLRPNLFFEIPQVLRSQKF